MNNYKENIIRILLSFFLIGIWILISSEIFKNGAPEFQANSGHIGNNVTSNITNTFTDTKKIKKLAEKEKGNKQKNKDIDTQEEDTVVQKIKNIPQNDKIEKDKLKENKLNIAKKLSIKQDQDSLSVKAKIPKNNTIKEKIIVKTEKAKISSLKFNDDGKFLAVGRENGKLELWSGKDKKFITYLGNEQISHKKRINALAFSGNNKFLISGSDDCQLIKWDITNKKAFRVEKVQLPIFSVAISETGDYFLAGTKNNAYFFNKNQSEPDLINHYGDVKSIAILSSKNMIFTCPTGFNHRRIKPKLKVWKVPPKWPVYKYKFSGKFVISKQKNILLAWNDKKISVYKLNNRRWSYNFLTLNKSIKKIVFLKDNNFFLVLNNKNEFICYNLESKKIVYQSTHPEIKGGLVFAVDPITNEAVRGDKQGNISFTSLKLKKG